VSRPNLFELPVWGDLEQRVHEIFARALIGLAQEPRLPREEDPLNRKLLHSCRRANYELRREGRGLPCPIFYEASNQPVADDPERASRLRKRPDFQCGYHDDLADNAEDSELFYTVECKRLGLPTRSDWVLNLNYVVNGINRFIRGESGYAKGAPSGMMIGYIQSMEPEAVLFEVNQNALSQGVPAITLPPGAWVSQGLTVLNPHVFPRDIEPRTFSLCHHWIDLRHRETFEATPKNPPKKTKKKSKRNPGADTPTSAS
jgi:hypothetical protein